MWTVLEVLLALVIFESLKTIWKVLQDRWGHRSADRETDEYIERLPRKLEDDQVLAEGCIDSGAQKCPSLEASTYYRHTEIVERWLRHPVFRRELEALFELLRSIQKELQNFDPAADDKWARGRTFCEHCDQA